MSKDYIHIFYEWVKLQNPPQLTRLVLGNLVNKYSHGNPNALFSKMLQLERDEFYELCVYFRDLLIHMELMDEYESWKNG